MGLITDKAAPLVDKVMSSASYSGAVVSVATGLTLTEWGVVVGIVTALLTFAANLVWQIRRDRRTQNIQNRKEHRQQQLWELQMQNLRTAAGSRDELSMCGAAYASNDE